MVVTVQVVRKSLLSVLPVHQTTRLTLLILSHAPSVSVITRLVLSEIKLIALRKPITQHRLSPLLPTTPQTLTGDPCRSLREFKTRVIVEAVGHSVQLQALSLHLLLRQVIFINCLSSTLSAARPIGMVVMEAGKTLHYISLVRMEQSSLKITNTYQEHLGIQKNAMKKISPEPLSKKLSQLASLLVWITLVLKPLCVKNH